MLLLLLISLILQCCYPIPLKVKLSSTNSRLPSIPYDVQVIKPVKLPVWPVYSGVVAQLCDWLNLNDLTESIISKFGGRVIPITLVNQNDPFLLLVHHAHSFAPFDPIRPLQKLFIQEGFPAHPHSGFDTVTITIESGLKHRDDEGLIQTYSDGDTQWMRGGRGIIHEEMWDLDKSNKLNEFKKVEIYQLWVNLPSRVKDSEPLVNLINANELDFIDIDENVKVQVICGDIVLADKVINGPGNVMCESDISIMQIKLTPNAKLVINSDPNVSLTCFVRRGSIVLDNDEEIIYGNYMKVNNDNSKDLSTYIKAGAKGLDALLLLGKPLYEPCLFQGAFVQSDEKKLRRSYKIFSDLDMFWDHSISDDSYRSFVKRVKLQERIVKEINKERVVKREREVKCERRTKRERGRVEIGR
jgi:redox-sensitive bicupin YhaK (pirin superfamily)